MAPAVFPHPEARPTESEGTVDEVRIPVSGDPYYAASLGYSLTPDEERTHEATPHACYRGVVYVGHMVHDEETGEEVEILDSVPCLKCQRS
jgi:hypothetical protein